MTGNIFAKYKSLRHFFYIYQPIHIPPSSVGTVGGLEDLNLTETLNFPELFLDVETGAKSLTSSSFWMWFAKILLLVLNLEKQLLNPKFRHPKKFSNPKLFPDPHIILKPKNFSHPKIFCNRQIFLNSKALSIFGSNNFGVNNFRLSILGVS